MNPHVPDAELLLLADGEGAPRWQAHFDSCTECQRRLRQLENRMADVVNLQAPMLDVPALDDSLLRLQARMSVDVPQMPPPPQARSFAWAGISLALLLSVGGAWWLNARAEQPAKPDARLTPGATLAVSREQVCALPEDDEPRMVSPSMARMVFTSYGIAAPKPRSYEVDYLITPALGGATDVRNLWPQPYSSGVWNAQVKDALEDHLRHLVCQGKLDLPQAQQEIARDWIAAYRKYFHTAQPLAAHAGFIKDRPWE